MSLPVVDSCCSRNTSPAFEPSELSPGSSTNPSASHENISSSQPVHFAGNRATCPFASASSPDMPTLAVGNGDGGHKKLYYADYLRLDQVLNAQNPISFMKGNPCHDEMLFIVIHQTYELWFKQLLFELDTVRAVLAALNIGEKLISLALHRLTRIREILKLLNDQMRVLETMSPQEFLEFRDYLFPASGFQSFQFRLLEIRLGVRPQDRVNGRWIKGLSPEHQHVVREAQQEPSLFDYVERWLRNIPFREYRGYNFQKSYESAITRMFEIERRTILTKLEPADRGAMLAELSNTYKTFESVFKREVHEELIKTEKRRMGFRATSASLMITLYQEEPMFQLPARFLQMLVDVDEQLNRWRHAHSQMVHRMIGIKAGTGGSLGHNYLKRTVDSQRVFSDLANLSTLLIPRRLLPPLPSVLRDQMRYFHSVEMYDRTMFEVGGGGDEIDWSFC
ncbi:Tryptophan 2,3-dioxygenase [Gracilariopsis chorda]|uniref:Tryptophan 2,3-dioxygenase n=1 Tax=Gracilariopsis chorda TaxID=448386 RepID=A0A2V3IL30_9FLOR|nr:Tryptophan 2,3-dioxygenase [Gracilariopsis chorda]|eukprot:PXF42786.1 Tryptophan 2,3-dioxygenase [Gracilariopsis chorda]